MHESRSDVFVLPAVRFRDSFPDDQDASRSLSIVAGVVDGLTKAIRKQQKKRSK